LKTKETLFMQLFGVTARGFLLHIKQDTPFPSPQGVLK